MPLRSRLRKMELISSYRAETLKQEKQWSKNFVPWVLRRSLF